MLSFVVITGYYRNAEIKVNQHLVGFLQVFTFSTHISLRWSMGTQILIFQSAKILSDIVHKQHLHYLFTKEQATTKCTGDTG